MERPPVGLPSADDFLAKKRARAMRFAAGKPDSAVSESPLSQDRLDLRAQKFGTVRVFLLFHDRFLAEYCY
jgi:hypothetical protein